MGIAIAFPDAHVHRGYTPMTLASSVPSTATIQQRFCCTLKSVRQKGSNGLSFQGSTSEHPNAGSRLFGRRVLDALAPWHALLFTASLTLKLYYVHFNLGLGDSWSQGILGSLWLFTAAFAFAGLSLAPRLGPRWRAAIHAVFALALEVDLVYYRFYGNLPVSGAVKQAGGLGSVVSDVLGLLHPSDLVLVLDLPVLVWLAVRAHRRARGPRRRHALAGFAACAALLGLLHGNAPPFAFALRWRSQPDLVLRYGVFHYQVSQLIHDALAPAAKADPHVEQRLARRLAAQPPELGALTGRYRGKNVLVVQVESLQNFVIGRSVNGAAITPNLNALVAHSLYFPHFYHETGAGHTADAEFLTQNGLYGEAQGIAYSDLTNQHLRALPHYLDAAGYTTFSMHGNNGAFYNRAAIHPRLGFEHTYFRERLNANDILGWGLSDKSFLAQALDKATPRGRPFYGFLITLSSHYPFDWGYPTSHPLPLGTLAGTPLGQYLTAIHYTDEALGEFLTGLARRGRLNDTLIAIYGDHNAITRQDFDSLEAFLHADQQPDSWALSQRVPLILHLPDGRAGRVDKVGGEVDLAPTLADLLGVKAPILHAVGRDLLAPGPGRAVFRDGTWVNAQVVCLHTLTAAREAYDVETGQPVPFARVRAQDADAQRALARSDAIVNGDLAARLAADVRRLSARSRGPAVDPLVANRSQ